MQNNFCSFQVLMLLLIDEITSFFLILVSDCFPNDARESPSFSPCVVFLIENFPGNSPPHGKFSHRECPLPADKFPYISQ